MKSLVMRNLHAIEPLRVSCEFTTAQFTYLRIRRCSSKRLNLPFVLLHRV